VTNQTMDSSQWFWLSIYVIVPFLCIYALATKDRAVKFWLSRFLAVLLVGFICASTIYFNVQSVVTKEAGIMLVLAAWLWLQSNAKAR
jgi:hypothetical protein